MSFRCIMGFHKLKDIKEQMSKCYYGDGCGVPGIRITRKCELCGYTDYQSLNICVPHRDIINDYIWRD